LTYPAPAAKIERLCPRSMWACGAVWERASMAWKRSSVRSRPGPPINQQLSGSASSGLVAFGSKFSKPCCEGVLNLPALLLSCNVRRLDTFPSQDSILMGRDVSLFSTDLVLFGLGLLVSSRWMESTFPARLPESPACKYRWSLPCESVAAHLARPSPFPTFEPRLQLSSESPGM
jgi:hypothetical protein